MIDKIKKNLPLIFYGADIKNGLTTQEVIKRREKFGLNEIAEKELTPWQRILKKFIGPIPWMIETAAVLSFIVKKWDDFIIILVLLFVNVFVDYFQENKAMSAIKVLKKNLSNSALVKRDGFWQEIEARDLVPGDITKIKIGDIVPGDIYIYEILQYLTVDESMLTGESLPVDKKKGENIYANVVVKKGEAKAIVLATGSNTYYGRTVKLISKTEKEEISHSQKMVIKVGKFLITNTVLVTALIFIVGLYRDENILELLTFSLVLTISAIPVAMPTVLTVTMAIGAMSLAKKQAIVSQLTAIEELAGVDVLCVDKTGTLTKNIMTVAEPYTVKKYSVFDLFIYAALASHEENKDPIEKPIFEYIKQHGLKEKISDYKLKKFIPFNPVSKRTEAVLENKKDSLIIIKGAPQVILEHSNHKDIDVSQVNNKIVEFAEKGFRSLGVAFKKSHEKKYHFLGLIPLYDPLREDSQEVMQNIRNNGISTKMITGDNLAIANYTGRLLNFKNKIEDIKNVLSKFKALKNKKAQKTADDFTKIIEKADGFAQVMPEDKYFIINELQKNNHYVGMTGDGVNDAPALKKADIGIAVSSACDAARASSDIILIKPGLKVITDAIYTARIIFERMKSYTIFRITETIRIIFFMAIAIIVFGFYPITPLMIIVLALLNDIPILSIAYDHTKINESPVRWNFKEVFTLSFWLGTAGVISSLLLLFLLNSYFELPVEIIQSLFFCKLVVAGHGTIYNTRTSDWFFKKPFPSRILFFSTFSTRILGTIVAVYGFGIMFSIGWEWAIFMWLYALIWLFFNDLIKVGIIRNFNK